MLLLPPYKCWEASGTKRCEKRGFVFKSNYSARIETFKVLRAFKKTIACRATHNLVATRSSDCLIVQLPCGSKGQQILGSTDPFALFVVRISAISTHFA
jgi:hypothetical protein